MRLDVMVVELFALVYSLLPMPLLLLTIPAFHCQIHYFGKLAVRLYESIVHVSMTNLQIPNANAIMNSYSDSPKNADCVVRNAP